MRLLRGGLLLVEAHHAALAQNGHDAGDAEFSGFLHNEVHVIAARHALHKGDLEGRFPVDETRRADATETREPRAASMVPQKSPPSPLNRTT